MSKQKIYIYADFDWLQSIECVGTLSYERLRGSDSYGFEFSRDWLQKHGEITLSDDLSNFPSLQFTQPGRDIFGCFADALPDRWGRTLLKRREEIEAEQDGRPVKQLSSYDFLLGIDDFSRMGGFRLKQDQDGDFINMQMNFRIPPIANIRDLLYASEEIERNEEKNTLPEKRWVEQLIMPGTSLGGARPKANVMDGNNLFIAKFPSRKDDYDVAAWEHFAHLLAKEAGINCAETELLSVGDKYHTLLSRRFDRTVRGQRIHFASAMTLLGLTDGDNANNGHGYLDIVDFIIQGCTDVENNLRELYRRVAFNICIGNSDDHFRNHGFLLTKKGWTLSPAYDMNPTLNDYQSLLINADTSRASLQVLLDSADYYMLPSADAVRIIKEVKTAVGNWKDIANILQLNQREIKMFAPRFENPIYID